MKKYLSIALFTLLFSYQIQSMEIELPILPDTIWCHIAYYLELPDIVSLRCVTNHLQSSLGLEKFFMQNKNKLPSDILANHMMFCFKHNNKNSLHSLMNKLTDEEVTKYLEHIVHSRDFQLFKYLAQKNSHVPGILFLMLLKETKMYLDDITSNSIQASTNRDYNKFKRISEFLDELYESGWNATKLPKPNKPIAPEHGNPGIPAPIPGGVVPPHAVKASSPFPKYLLGAFGVVAVCYGAKKLYNWWKAPQEREDSKDDTSENKHNDAQKNIDLLV